LSPAGREAPKRWLARSGSDTQGRGTLKFTLHAQENLRSEAGTNPSMQAVDRRTGKIGCGVRPLHTHYDEGIQKKGHQASMRAKSIQNKGSITLHKHVSKRVQSRHQRTQDTQQRQSTPDDSRQHHHHPPSCTRGLALRRRRRRRHDRRKHRCRWSRLCLHLPRPDNHHRPIPVHHHKQQRRLRRQHVRIRRRLRLVQDVRPVMMTTNVRKGPGERRFRLGGTWARCRTYEPSLLTV